MLLSGHTLHTHTYIYNIQKSCKTQNLFGSLVHVSALLVDRVCNEFKCLLQQPNRCSDNPLLTARHQAFPVNAVEMDCAFANPSAGTAWHGWCLLEIVLILNIYIGLSWMANSSSWFFLKLIYLETFFLLLSTVCM